MTSSYRTCVIVTNVVHMVTNSWWL